MPYPDQQAKQQRVCLSLTHHDWEAWGLVDFSLPEKDTLWRAMKEEAGKVAERLGAESIVVTTHPFEADAKSSFDHAEALGSFPEEVDWHLERADERDLGTL